MPRNFLIFLLGVLLFPGIGFCTPASPELRELSQPDGTTFLARQWGDERLHGWETEAGYAVLFDDRLHAWAYAQHDDDGNLVSSGKVVDAGLPEEFSKDLRPTGKALNRILRLRRRLAQTAVQVKAVPSMGKGKIPVILMNYHDRVHTKTVANFTGLLRHRQQQPRGLLQGSLLRQIRSWWSGEGLVHRI